MKIAILGAKDVGSTLGRRFVEVGHAASFGVRDPKAYENAELPGPVGTVENAVAGSDIVLLAIPFASAQTALAECGDLTGKIVIDATNPLAMGPNGLYLTVGFDTSAAEQIEPHVAGGKLVKCFNSTGYGNMANPRGSMMFVCGNDPEANDTVRQLSDEIGFETKDLGDLTKARLLEPLAMLWIHLAFTTDLKRDFAFSISRAGQAN